MTAGRGIEDAPEVQPVEAGDEQPVATIGLVKNRDTRCAARPAATPADPADALSCGRQRPQRQRDRAPSTSSTGASIDSSMCAAMCMLNIAGMYRPIPDEVANKQHRAAHSHATIRPVGHASPRRRSRRNPARYTTARRSPRSRR